MWRRFRYCTGRTVAVHCCCIHCATAIPCRKTCPLPRVYWAYAMITHGGTCEVGQAPTTNDQISSRKNVNNQARGGGTESRRARPPPTTGPTDPPTTPNHPEEPRHKGRHRARATRTSQTQPTNPHPPPNPLRPTANFMAAGPIPRSKLGAAIGGRHTIKRAVRPSTVSPQ